MFSFRERQLQSLMAETLIKECVDILSPPLSLEFEEKCCRTRAVSWSQKSQLTQKTFLYLNFLCNKKEDLYSWEAFCKNI